MPTINIEECIRNHDEENISQFIESYKAFELQFISMMIGVCRGEELDEAALMELDRGFSERYELSPELRDVIQTHCPQDDDVKDVLNVIQFQGLRRTHRTQEQQIQILEGFRVRVSQPERWEGLSDALNSAVLGNSLRQ